MQATRWHILDILKRKGQATVEELSQELNLTTVTVRHHLDILRGEGLVAAPTAHRRKTPGRPQYTYTLTEKASALFPKRYEQLAMLILDEIQSCLPPAEVERLMKRIGEHIADQTTPPQQGGLEARLTAAVDFLNEWGYMAHWERDGDGNYALRIFNCPYEHIAKSDRETCAVDIALLTRLLGVAPRRTDWYAQGDRHCTYIIRPEP